MLSILGTTFSQTDYHMAFVQEINRKIADRQLLVKCYYNKWLSRPAAVAWFVKASVFHSVNSAPSANGGSNPDWECCIDRLNSKEFVAIH